MPCGPSWHRIPRYGGFCSPPATSSCDPTTFRSRTPRESGATLKSGWTSAANCNALPPIPHDRDFSTGCHRLRPHYILNGRECGWHACPIGQRVAAGGEIADDEHTTLGSNGSHCWRQGSRCAARLQGAGVKSQCDQSTISHIEQVTSCKHHPRFHCHDRLSLAAIQSGCPERVVAGLIRSRRIKEAPPSRQHL